MKTERILTRWGILMVGNCGPILAGCEGLEIYRTSTPLVAFDHFSLTGVTASGRPYRLLGAAEPGYALAACHSLWDAGNLKVRLVMPEDAVALIAHNGNAPHEFSEEEQLELDRAKIAHLAGEITRQMVAMNLTEKEAAWRSGLSIEKLRGLLEEDLTRIMADEADLAFVQLVGSTLLPDCDDVLARKP